MKVNETELAAGGMRRRWIRSAGCLFAFGLVAASANAGLLFEASLRDGEYGGGMVMDTFDPNHGGAPHMPGVVDTSDGVYFTSTETDGRSNGLINYQTGSARTSFVNHGTITLFIVADRETHVGGELFGDNYGYDAFRHGQSTFSASAVRVANGEGIEDDQVLLRWRTWHNAVWYTVGSVTLEYDRVHEVGFTWGGPGHDYELWVDGEMAVAFDLPAGIGFPLGTFNSATNIGLGSNHERGYGAYGSVVGVTFSDLRIWDEYRELGDTTPPPSGVPHEDRLVLRFDAGRGVFSDAGGTMPANPGEAVIRWSDRGPLDGDNFAKSGSFHGGGVWDPPVLSEVGVDHGLNGSHRAVRFNGGNGLVAETTGDGLAGIDNQEVSVFSVVRYDGTANGYLCGARYGQPGDGWEGAFGMAWFTGWNDTGGYLGGARSPDATINSYAGLEPTGTFAIQSFVNGGYDGQFWWSFRGVSNGLELDFEPGNRVDSALRDLRVDPTWPSPSFTSLVLGRSDTSAGGYLRGEVVELLVYDGTFNEEQGAAVERYLWRKYFEVGYPRLEIARTATGVELSWEAFERFRYRVQRSLDLVGWDVVSDVLSGATGERLVFPEDLDGSAPNDAYYRLEILTGGGGS